MKDLESELLEFKSQYTRLQTNHDKGLQENAETVRNLKVLKIIFKYFQIFHIYFTVPCRDPVTVLSTTAV